MPSPLHDAPITSPLRAALAANLGRVLTPEVAVAIELASAAPADLAHDPRKFGRDELGEYGIQVERLADIVDEIHPLHQAHWLETEKHRNGLPLQLDYAYMLARERSGELLQFTVRHRGELVGNLRMYLATSLHSGTTFAEEDTLYITPEHRGGMLAMRLLRFAEGCLIAVGVREIRANSKLVNRADVLMRRMGYQPVALQFVKIIGDHDV